MKKYIATTIAALACALAFADSAKLENDKLLVEFDSNGNLVHFKNKADNVDYAGGQGLWRIIYQKGELLEEPVECENTLATVVRVSGTEAKILYGGEFPVEVSCKLDGDDAVFSAKVSNNSEGKILREFQFPMIKNANLDRGVKLIHSGGGGGVINNLYGNVVSATAARPYKAQDNKAVERYSIYPTERTMNMFVLQGKKSSLMFASLDPNFEVTLHLFRYRKENDQFKYFDVAMVKYPFIKKGESYQTAPFVVSPHMGDWRVSAKKYAKGATWFKPGPKPDFIKKMNGWHRIILRHQYGTILFPYSELETKINKSGKDCGIDTILLFGWWFEGMDAGYPDYTPEASQGGDAELKKRIADVHAKGGKVILYFNGQLIDVSTKFYKELGEKICVKTPSGLPHIERYPFGGEGTGLRALGHKTFVTACHGTKEWEEVLKGYVDRALSLGVDGVFLDQLGNGSQICWDETHGHKVPCTDMMRHKSEMLKKIRAYIKEKNPNIAFGVEYVGDATSMRVDFVHTCGFDYKMQSSGKSKPEFSFVPLFRYAFPEVVVSDRTIRDNTDVERRMNACLMWGLISDIEIYRCRATIDSAPDYKAYMKKINALRDKYRPLILNGMYRDRDLAKVSNDKLYYSTFENDSEIAVVITNLLSKPESATVSVGGAQFHWADGIGGYEVSAKEGDPKVKLGKNDLAVLVFKKNK